uniref:Carbon-nitrogen hydrolase family protein n=1 Tax=Thermorudis peleae TaxID=1382356 RepID=A0A831TD48_9BACT
MRVTVCELPDGAEGFARAWSQLVQHVREEQSDLVLLPEMPAVAWFCGLPQFQPGIWQAAVVAHLELLERLGELAGTIVLGSRPVERGGARLNQAFAWTTEGGYQPVHEKRFLPDHQGFFEARWFDRGPDAFAVASVEGVAIGFLVCSDAMFPERARHYGRQGAQLIAVPRATGGHDRWLVAARMAAIVSGAYVLSSNRAGDAALDPAFRFGGRGWVIDPEGEVLAETSTARPFVTVEIDLEATAVARRTYPRYLS